MVIRTVISVFRIKMNALRLELILLRGLIVIAATSLCAMVGFYVVAEVWIPGNKPFDEWYIALVFGMPVGSLVGIALGVYLASKVRGKKMAP